MITKIISVVNITMGWLSIMFSHGEMQIMGLAALVIGMGLAFMIYIDEKQT